MLLKLKKEDGTPICGQKTFRFLTRMTRKSPYKRMDGDGKEKKSKKREDKKAEECSKGKENWTFSTKEVKEKKSKKKVSY